MRLAIFVLAIVTPFAAALPPPSVVHGVGLATVTTPAGTCEVAVEFHAEFDHHTGLTYVSPGECSIYAVLLWDGEQCHEFCFGSCEDLGGGDAFCHNGESGPDDSQYQSRLRPDGTWYLNLGDWIGHGQLIRTAS